MSRKKFRLDRNRDFFSTASPLTIGFDAIAMSFAFRVERAASQWWLNVPTMVLSEARGL
jgi:hypothetical protein